MVSSDRDTCSYFFIKKFLILKTVTFNTVLHQGGRSKYYCFPFTRLWKTYSHSSVSLYTSEDPALLLYLTSDEQSGSH